jgi:hypothetical protein
VDLRLEYEALGVYQQMTLSSFDLLASIVTPLFPAYRGALDLPWESTMPALGCGSLPRRTRNRSRMARLIRSQVPSLSAIV